MMRDGGAKWRYSMANATYGRTCEGLAGVQVVIARLSGKGGVVDGVDGGARW